MMKKKLLFLLLSLLMTGSAFADCLMYIDDFTLTRDQLGTVIELPVKALYSARLNIWSLDITYPEGLTPINARPGADYDISYINSSGNSAIFTPIFSQYNDYTKLMGYALEPGYWYDPNNGNALTSYGAVKWEVGTYEEMIVLYVRVSEDFRGGEIVLNSEFSCTDDARGGTIRDVYGQQSVDYTVVCDVTLSSLEAYACYTSNTTLTFYYDTQRASRPGSTYDLGTSYSDPGWYSAGIYSSVIRVVFDSSFADARPRSTYAWFYGMSKLSSITGMEYLNTEEVTDMDWMFYNCSSLTSLDLSSFNTTNVTSMNFMFYLCSSLTSLDLSSFNTANVTGMTYMFSDCEALTSLDLSSFNTSKVTSMDYMFYLCKSLTSLDLSSFNTAKVTNMEDMFNGCYDLTAIYAGEGWSTAAVTKSSAMFYFCFDLVGDKGTAYDPNHVDAEYAHLDGGPSNPGYFSEVPPEAYACYTPENTTLTFYCDYLRSTRPGTTYDLNKAGFYPKWYLDGTYSSVTQAVFDPSFADARPTATNSWFYSMSNLSSITGMEYFNTSEVYIMSSMFSNCTGLTSLDLSNFNTEKVKDMIYMFRNCSALTTIFVGDGWSTAAVVSTWSFGMFENCTNLMGGQGTAYDANHVEAEYAHIDGGPSNPGYFTYKPAYIRGDVNGDGVVDIADVTAMIDLLLTNSGNSNPAADCNDDDNVDIADVTSLIDYLLKGVW